MSKNFTVELEGRSFVLFIIRKLEVCFQVLLTEMYLLLYSFLMDGYAMASHCYIANVNPQPRWYHLQTMMENDKVARVHEKRPITPFRPNS